MNGNDRANDEDDTAIGQQDDVEETDSERNDHGPDGRFRRGAGGVGERPLGLRVNKLAGVGLVADLFILAGSGHCGVDGRFGEEGRGGAGGNGCGGGGSDSGGSDSGRSGSGWWESRRGLSGRSGGSGWEGSRRLRGWRKSGGLSGRKLSGRGKSRWRLSNWLSGRRESWHRGSRRRSSRFQWYFSSRFQRHLSSWFQRQLSGRYIGILLT